MQLNSVKLCKVKVTTSRAEDWIYPALNAYKNNVRLSEIRVSAFVFSFGINSSFITLFWRLLPANWLLLNGSFQPENVHPTFIFLLKTTMYLFPVSEVWKDALWFLNDKLFHLALRANSLEEQAFSMSKMTLLFSNSKVLFCKKFTEVFFFFTSFIFMVQVDQNQALSVFFSFCIW